MADKHLSYIELRQLAEDNPIVAAWVRGLRKELCRAMTLTPEELGFRVKVREPTDDELRERVAVAIRCHAEVAPQMDEPCDCPPGVPVLATNPGHCPRCGGIR